MSIIFNNTVFPAGYVGEDDGMPAQSFGIDAQSQNPITIYGTVTRVGDTVTAVGVLPGGDDTGITSTTNTLTVTQFDNSGQILFSIQGQGDAAGDPFRIVLSNTILTPPANGQYRVSFASDPALVNGTGGDVYQPVCFASGTRIRTVNGDVAVEALTVGDLVVTATGQHRPIRWIGHRTLDCRRHPDPRAAWPVRVAAHAFGEGRPARDLRLSLGHAVCLDMLGEVLVPAFALLNGATVRQEEVASVTYWHVELDSHDVILAEGMPCESYLDLGNRGFFQNSGVVALDARPDGMLADMLDAPRGTMGTPSATGTLTDYCRPLHLGGALVDAARLQLRRRAEAAGWRLAAGDPLAGLHLIADGRRVVPTVRGLAACFAVPAGARDLWLVADAVRPCDCGDGADGRALGVRVAGLTVTNGFGSARTIALDNIKLQEGWHAVEVEAGGPVRWTTGRAQLPAELLSDGAMGAPLLLRVNLNRPALPSWVAPGVVIDHMTQTAVA